MATIYERNYRKLLQLIPTLEAMKPGDHFKMVAEGFMDLSVEAIGRNEHQRLLLSLCHYGVQNGDLMRDPEMELEVDTTHKRVEALSFRNDYMGYHRVVYPKPGFFHPRQKREQNSFLDTWLKNLLAQGHKRPEDKPPSLLGFVSA